VNGAPAPYEGAGTDAFLGPDVGAGGGDDFGVIEAGGGVNKDL
jgi:hypothetical protein